MRSLCCVTIASLANLLQQMRHSRDKLKGRGKKHRESIMIPKRKAREFYESPAIKGVLKGGIGEDIRTALHHAHVCIATLISLKSGAPPTSDPLIDPSALDRQWTENMTKLLGALKKNVRVPYELKVSEVVQACVVALFYELL